MSMHFIWLFIMMFGFMALGLSVGSCILFASFIYMWIFDIPVFSALVSGVSAPMSQTLLATGFFILAGNLMNRGGITDRIFNFARDVVGWIPGGLGHTNVLASVIFAGMSGSATADAGGLGQIEVEAMTKNGYDTDFSLAVTGGSTILSPIIPPSIPAVLLACITGASTGRLFMAGVIPGIIYAGIMMVMITIMSIKRKYPRDPLPKGKQFLKDFIAAFFPLLTPVIILGSIYTGVVTPSEAATLAGVYAIVVGLCTRDLKMKELPHIFREGVQLLGSILYITVAAKVFSYIITLEQVPTIVAELMVKGIHSSFGCLMVVAVILLICGCVMDGTATIFIVAPVLFPVATSFGVDPVQFCIVFAFTLMIGVITPPFGMVLFVLQGMSGIEYGRLCKAMVPFIILALVMMMILILFPSVSTFLPNLIYGT